MNTPPTLFEELRTLLLVQVVDTRIDRARAALAALNSGASTAAAYNTTKTEAERLRAAAVKAQAEQRDAELRLATIETKSKQVDKTMNSGKGQGARELENLGKELEMLARQKSTAEDAVLVAMEGANAAISQAEAAETQQAALADRYRALRTAYKEQHAVLSEEIAVAERERATVAVPVSKAILARYDAIRARKSGIGIAPLEPDNSCGVCRTHLNTYLTDAVFAAREVQTCEYCGRLLSPLPLPVA